ncbi:hypothetical protein [Limnospira platensis]|uniref:hypothetical protein n=1 Tax=Limnospira platensis TaxID=118562 RepID=UPI00396C7F86
MMINSVPANGKLPPELAFAQRARQKYRLASGKCDLSPTFSEVRPIAYPLGSAIVLPIIQARYRTTSDRNVIVAHF